MNMKEEMNFYKNYMNGLDIIVWNYYIGEQKMAKGVIFSIKNVIIKDLLYVYAKMKKGIYLVDMLPYLGLCHASDRGPHFGGKCDLYIDNNPFNNNSSDCYLGGSYPDVLGKGNSVFSGDANTNNTVSHFKLKEIEVFKLVNH